MKFLQSIPIILVLREFNCCYINEKDFDKLVSISTEVYKFVKPTNVDVHFNKKCSTGNLF